jgi:hypothetical protein
VPKGDTKKARGRPATTPGSVLGGMMIYGGFPVDLSNLVSKMYNLCRV